MSILDYDTATIPAHLHRLAHTTQVAAFGPDGVFDPDWLSDTADALIIAAHDLHTIAARARHAADTDGAR